MGTLLEKGQKYLNLESIKSGQGHPAGLTEKFGSFLIAFFKILHLFIDLPFCLSSRLTVPFKLTIKDIKIIWNPVLIDFDLMLKTY